MRYYLLRQDARPDLWRLVFLRDAALDALRSGVPLDAPAGPARVVVAGAGDAPSDFFERPCPVVSDAMRRALDGAGVDNVQYFPARVEIQHDEGPPVADYWIANVVGAVACAQALPTDGAGAGGGRAAPAPAPRFRIDPVRARGLDLFRLAEDRRLLVVSERVADALRAAGLRGLVVQAPEDYTGRGVSTAPPQPRLATGV